MQNNNIDKFSELLEKVKPLLLPHKVEANIFNIGGRGYYENPTTDILAFFCNPFAEHDLGNIVLNAFINSLPTEKMPKNRDLISAPQREVVTKEVKRIDLILEGKDWVIVCENKIRHAMNNPFGEYAKYAEKAYPNKKIIYCILSPKGISSNENWQGISYETLIKNIKKELSTYFIENPLSKWVILLREFILNLEQEMQKTPKNIRKIILENIDDIRKIEFYKKQFYKELKDEFLELLQNDLKDLKFSYQENWNENMPVFVYSFDSWDNKAGIELVTWINEDNYAYSEDKNGKFTIQAYIETNSITELEKLKKYHHWEIQKLNRFCYTMIDTIAYEDFEEEDKIKELVDKIKELDKHIKRN